MSIFKDWFSREKISCGLDIGTQAIKMVTLKSSKDAIELTSFYLETAKPEEIPAALKKIADASGVKTVGISVSGPATVVRYVDFPQMSQEELQQSLKFEAQKYIPFPIDDVSLDSSLLKDNLPGARMLILLAAVKKEFINQRLKLIQDAGLAVDNVDFDSLALAKAFNFNYTKEEYGSAENKTVALINIGASMSNLNILDNGIPVLSRDIYIGGNNFIQPIEPVFSDLAKDVRGSFDYYESQGASSVIKILLSGGGSKFPGLKDALATLLGIEVEYWDPLKKITIAVESDAEKIRASSAQLAVAVGLALPK
jgi:type IV pilus assembly protein PilM